MRILLHMFQFMVICACFCGRLFSSAFQVDNIHTLYISIIPLSITLNSHNIIFKPRTSTDILWCTQLIKSANTLTSCPVFTPTHDTSFEVFSPYIRWTQTQRTHLSQAAYMCTHETTSTLCERAITRMYVANINSLLATRFSTSKSKCVSACKARSHTMHNTLVKYTKRLFSRHFAY